MKVNDKVCIWFDQENGQKMGVFGKVVRIEKETDAVTVEYYCLGSWLFRVFTAGQARTHITKHVE